MMRIKQTLAIVGLIGPIGTLARYSSSDKFTIDDCPSKCKCRETSDSEGVYVDCSNINLKQIPDSFPERTRSLDLSDNQIEKITQLPDMDELVLLNFTNNEIRAIHYDAFDGLDSLTTLVLSHNYLTNIDDDIFEWNPLKLRHLYLDHNRFEYVQHFLFYDLTELEEIDLSNNILYFVHPHAFTELDKLRRLDLSGNHLQKFETKWVKPLLDSTLIEVGLHDNNWQCDCSLEDKLSFFKDDQLKTLLDSALYRGHSTLKCADSKNKDRKLSELQAKDLMTCSKPQITGISKSSEVGASKSLLLKCVVSGQPKPTVTWRAPNEDVYRLTSDDFEGVTVHQDGSVLIEDIRHSDAGDYVCIATNPKGTVEAKTKITVTGDDIGELDRGDENFLEEPISEDDIAWGFDKGKKEWGSIQGGDFEELDAGDDFYDPGELYGEIEEDYKEIREQDCPVDCDCNSDVVDCSDSGDMDGGVAKTSIPTRLPHSATHLDMNVNEIDRIGYDICRNYPQLQELKLDDNIISDVDGDSFRSCGKLRILTLRHNRIKEITRGMFEDLHNVQILVLDNNFLEKIPDYAFEGMHELEYVYIRENRIQKIEKYAFHGLKNIRFIHLEDNKIQSLERDWIEAASMNEHLKRIFLEDNSINCDVRLKDFKEDFTREETKIYKIIQPADLECSYPIEQHGKSLDQINFNVLVVEPDLDQPAGGNAGLVILGIFLGIVLTALIFVVWRKWNRGHSLRHGRYTGLQGSINDDDNESRALTADQEAFI